jgi:glutamyl-tRNA synthetase
MEEKKEQIRTRVAPSPTGYAHLGIVYQSLFDYVFAHKYGGKFILRIEDTDRSRFVQGAEEVIIDSLKWVHLDPDEGIEKGGAYGPYRQSEKLDLYQKYAQQLIEKGHAYYCFCTKERLEQMRKQQESNHQAPRYDRTCRLLTKEEVQNMLDSNTPYVIRMKIPNNEKIVIEDAIVGEISFDSNQIDDQVLIKSDGYPTYHLAVVVDDYSMKISHIFRGTEWIPSTPKHILLWKYLGWEKSMPKFAHVPLLLNTEGGGKLSKRQGHSSVRYYREEGYLPEAIVNYLANVVWNHPDGKEIFPVEEFGEAFSLDPFKVEVKPQGAKFDLQKLLWMNGEYIRAMSDEALLMILIAYDTSLKVFDKDTLIAFVSIAKTRIKVLKEFKEMIVPFLQPTVFSFSEEQKDIRNALSASFTTIENWNSEEIGNVLFSQFIKPKKANFKQIYKAVINTDKGLPLADTFAVIGKEKTLALLAV